VFPVPVERICAAAGEECGGAVLLQVHLSVVDRVAF